MATTAAVSTKYCTIIVSQQTRILRTDRELKLFSSLLEVSRQPESRTGTAGAAVGGTATSVRYQLKLLNAGRSLSSQLSPLFLLYRPTVPASAVALPVPICQLSDWP